MSEAEERLFVPRKLKATVAGRSGVFMENEFSQGDFIFDFDSDAQRLDLVVGSEDSAVCLHVCALEVKDDDGLQEAAYPEWEDAYRGLCLVYPEARFTTLEVDGIQLVVYMVPHGD